MEPVVAGVVVEMGVLLLGEGLEGQHIYNHAGKYFQSRDIFRTNSERRRLYKSSWASPIRIQVARECPVSLHFDFGIEQIVVVVVVVGVSRSGSLDLVVAVLRSVIQNKYLCIRKKSYRWSWIRS